MMPKGKEAESLQTEWIAFADFLSELCLNLDWDGDLDAGTRKSIRC